MMLRCAARLLVPAIVVIGLAGCEGLKIEPPTEKLVNAPYVPSPERTVKVMLDMAKAGPGDVLYDLGSGDGRIPIAAARDYGVARAVGIEIDPELVKRSTETAQKSGVADRVRFMTADIFRTDFSDASIVTLYLLQDLNMALRPRLLNELRPGTRIVSHRFDLGDWLQDEYRDLVQPGAAPPIPYNDENINSLYLWIVPAKVHGNWRLAADGESISLRLVQGFQSVDGSISVPGAEGAIVNGRMDGKRFRFEASLLRQGRTVAVRFDGEVTGATMAGTLALDGRAAKATAQRVP